MVQSLQTPSRPQETSFGEQQGGWKRTYISAYNGMKATQKKINNKLLSPEINRKSVI